MCRCSRPPSTSGSTRRATSSPASATPAIACSARSRIFHGETDRKHTPGHSRPMIDGDTAWLLISAGLVMLMTPGLALFYGGRVQGKNVLSTFMHSFFALGLVTVQFAVIGYTLAFGPTWHGVIGHLDFLGLTGIAQTTTLDTVSHHT